MTHQPKRMAILVGGGPAPGINSVIGAATIRGVLSGAEVIGVRDGFKWIMRGNIDNITPLTIDQVSRIHFRGGSYIGIARDNPTKDKKHLENTITSLLRLNVDKLITIGGDDTAYSAYRVQQVAEGRISVVHVPKTIDNDLDLPHGICTFGFQTARHTGRCNHRGTSYRHYRRRPGDLSGYSAVRSRFSRRPWCEERCIDSPQPTRIACLRSRFRRVHCWYRFPAAPS